MSEIETDSREAEGGNAARRVVEVVVRFAIAEALLATLLLSGFSHTGDVPLGPILVLLASPVAMAWGLRRISGLTMFNVMLGALALSALGLASLPGGGDFGGFLVLGGACVVGGVTWVVLLNNRLGDEHGRSLRPFLVAPALGLFVIGAAKLGLPEEARVAASESALGALAGSPPSPADGEERGAVVEVTDGIPSSVGLFEVRAVRINAPGGDPMLQVVVSGDCGWFNDCTLTYSPDGTDFTHGHMLGDWYADW